MALAPSTSCITTSIDLVPGQSFVLPPNSKVIAASDIDNLTSVCADLDNLETYSCFVALIATNPDDGNVINYLEGSDDGPGGRAQGYRLNDVEYEFSRVYNVHASGGFPTGQIDDFQAMADELKKRVPGITSVKIAYITDNTRGVINYLFIKTIPSVANRLQIRMHGYLSGQAFQPNEVRFYTTFRPLDEITTLGYKMMLAPTSGFIPTPAIPLFTCNQI